MNSVRAYLQEELVRRCKANPRYSLRSFAKHLQMNPSLLSKILRGQVGVSPKRFEKICERMSLAPAERAELASAEDRKRTLRKQDHLFRELKNASSQMRDMADRFQIIADWYHYAILELIDVEGFTPDEEWIAKSLGITVREVSEAKERLCRIGILEITEDGRWRDMSGDGAKAQGEESSIALRELQSQVLQLAISALETTPEEARLQGSMTLAIDSSLVASAREKIIAFQRALATSLQAESRTKDSVYQMTVSFFPLAMTGEQSGHIAKDRTGIA